MELEHQKILKYLSKRPKLDENQILAAFKKQHASNVCVKSKDIGKPGFVVCVGNKKYFITERPISFYNKRSGRAYNIQKTMLRFSTPVPLYIGQGTLDKELHRILKSGNPDQEANRWLFKEFTIEVAMVYFNKYFSESNALKDFKTIIFEAIEAFYYGLDHIAIMSLIPVFEGGLRNLQSNILGTDKNNVGRKRFEHGIKELLLKRGAEILSEYDWYPGKDHKNDDAEIDFLTHINSQCDVINCFRLFFKEVFYKDSRTATGNFNRHVILHMLKNNFNEPANFIRIFLALTHITFVESLWNIKIPFLWPGIAAHDRELAKYIRSVSITFGEPRRVLLNKMGIAKYEKNV